MLKVLKIIIILRSNSANKYVCNYVLIIVTNNLVEKIIMFMSNYTNTPYERSL